MAEDDYSSYKNPYAQSTFGGGFSGDLGLGGMGMSMLTAGVGGDATRYMERCRTLERQKHELEVEKQELQRELEQTEVRGVRVFGGGGPGAHP